MYKGFASCTNSPTAQDVQAWWDTYAASSDTIFVRPSGNPLTLQGYCDMATSKDITEHSGHVIEIKHVTEFGPPGQHACAVVLFEGQQTFLYQGQPNNVSALYSVTVERDEANKTFKFVFMQRYPGKSNLE